MAVGRTDHFGISQDKFRPIYFKLQEDILMVGIACQDLEYFRTLDDNWYNDR
jgi:hypothetical protein